jgi:hypothetical protein
MNVVPGVTRSRVAGKNHADKTFFNRDRFPDFELRLIGAACNVRCGGGCFTLSHCDAPGAAHDDLLKASPKV